MPQMQLPIFPDSVAHITNELAVQKGGGRIIYFNGSMPIFSHAEKDTASFWMITSQFCEQGICNQVDIIRVFGVSPTTMKRKVKRYREEGPKGFFRGKGSRGATVLIPCRIEQAQEGLDRGRSIQEIATEMGIKPDTLRKAIQDGRLYRLSNEEEKKDVSMGKGTIAES